MIEKEALGKRENAPFSVPKGSPFGTVKMRGDVVTRNTLEMTDIFKNERRRKFKTDYFAMPLGSDSR